MKVEDLFSINLEPNPEAKAPSWSEYISSLNGLKGLIEYSQQRGLQDFSVEEVLSEYYSDCYPYEDF